MKDRIKKLEDAQPSTKPGEVLLQIAKSWHAAVWCAHDFKKALALRKQAQPFFEEHPAFIDDPPKSTKRTLYIAWSWFAEYTDSYLREYYNNAAKKNHLNKTIQQVKAKKHE